ncbi:MAG TPA: alkaline phosphatase family protein [Mycobacterium sp.]|nr:alkaline phosphatase family protein [Mycobacterium sp.]
MDLPVPDPALPYLADVTPALLACLGVPEFAGAGDRLGLRRQAPATALLLIDGLGAELLDAHAADAPVLAGMRGRTLQVGFPSTTVAGLAAVGTGCRSGAHGMVGMTCRLGEPGEVVNVLRWRGQTSGADLRGTLVPEEVQPMPTALERATAAGIAVAVVSGAEFADSGLTRAVLRGGRYVGVLGLGDLAANVRAALSGGGFCYGYHGELDLLGHLHGPGSMPWRMQLRQVDRLVESIVEGLPPGSVLAVVADHGMVEVGPGDTVDVEADPALGEGVAAVGGEARARHVYATPGAVDDVQAAWRSVLGDRAWVAGRDEAIAAGWFGDTVADAVRPRIGDVVAAARGSAVLVRPRAEPLESALIGQHGSLTSAEQRVPLLLAYG